MKATCFFFARAVGKIISGLWVGKIIIMIPRFVVGSSENNKISINEVTYESDHILLVHDSAMPSAVNVCVLSILLKPKRRKSY